MKTVLLSKYTSFFLIVMTPEFSLQIFFNNIQISNFMKIRPVAAELFHAEGQTDMDGRS